MFYTTSLPSELLVLLILSEAVILQIVSLYVWYHVNCKLYIIERAIKVDNMGFLTYQVLVWIVIYYFPYENIFKYVFDFFFFRFFSFMGFFHLMGTIKIIIILLWYSQGS